ncbi:MAG: DUF805 domain-containing protein [Gammaproteobacteria bacterium]|nr:MAG: DUF805 domain-containing protein [Gammaproteobacteria bacterium]UTW42244.1 DUF805 domain-containing protein [bacterium SCSIO 12844]
MSIYKYFKLDRRLARVEYLSLILFWGALFEVVLLLAFIINNYTQYLSLSNFLISIACALYLWFVFKVIICMIRRFHDINLSGWFTLVTLIPAIGYLAIVILCFIPGTEGINRFGILAKKPTKKMLWVIFSSAVVTILSSVWLAYMLIDIVSKAFG